MIKRNFVFLLALIWMISLFGCSKYDFFEETAVSYTVEDGVKVYTEDFTETYADTLSVMFGETCTISDPEEEYWEAEHCDCGHLDERDERYYQWVISYTDGDNTRRHFLLKNNEALSTQVETYVENMISDYFETNYLSKYTEDLSLNEGGTYVFCFLVDMTVDQNEVPEKLEKTDAYRKGLEQAESCIHFSELKMQDIFQTCPLYLSVQFSVNGFLSTEEKAWENAQAMAAEVNTFTGNTMNAQLSVYTEGNKTHHNEQEAFINGEISDYGIYFERDVFDSYTGVFW